MATFTATGATGGAFDSDAGNYAIGRSQVTTTEPTKEVSYSFTVMRRPLVLRVGAAAGDQDIVQDTTFEPGYHVFSFTPGVSPYFMEFQLREVGEATLSGLARIAPGLFSLTTPYDEIAFPNMRSEQSLNVQWWADGLRCPRVLERRGNSSWGLRLFQPKDGPFDNNETSGVTLEPDGQTGTVTIEASGPVFKASDAGSLIRLTQPGQFKTASADSIDDATDTIRVSGTGAARTFFWSVTGTFSASVTLQRSVGSEVNWVDVTTVTTPTTTSLSDGLDGQIVYYRLKVTAYTSDTPVMSLTYSGGITDGVARIFSVDADNEVTADVLTPFASTSPTTIWARGSWSDRFGWPTCPALFDGRLTFLRGGRRWQSTSDDFESFGIGAEADDAISGTIPGRMNVPRWAKAGDRLMIGTAGGEGYISAGRDDEVMTPDNARARIRTERGAYNADAVHVDGMPAFIHRSGRKLHLMVWNGSEYELLNLSRLHRDIAGVCNGGFTELAFQSEPEPRLYARRSDGQCAVMLISLADRLGGWMRLVPTGEDAAIESVCVVPGTPEDHVYRVVKRTIGGTTKRYVEKQAKERWGNSSHAWRLESALLYSGTATTAISGLGHLEGEQVYAWADGRVDGPHTVTSGAITLTYAASYVIVGLKYQGFYRGPRAPNLAKSKKIERLGMLLHNTVGGGVSWGRNFTTMSRLKDRLMEGATYDSPLPLISEDVDFPISGSWENDGRVCIRFEGVGPATVLGLAVTTAS